MKTAGVAHEEDLFRSLDNITTHNDNQELDIECDFNDQLQMKLGKHHQQSSVEEDGIECTFRTNKLIMPATAT